MNRKIWIFISIIFWGIALIAVQSCKSKNEQEGHQDHSQPSLKKQMYHCPMHPTYTSDKPGDCPICNMKLVPVEEEEHEKSIQGESHGTDKSGTTSEVQGYASIKLTPEREQLISIKTTEVAYRDLQKVIRAAARVAYDTELYNAIAEYKAAITAKEKIKDSPWPDVHERAYALIRSASLRLRQLGLSEKQIENMNDDYQNPTNLLLGEKGGSIWIYANIYEYESGLVKPGQKMEVTAPALPGKTFSGVIKSIDPILNSETRSLRVRAEVPNREGLLKPEMYVNARIVVDLGSKLSVPEEAVLNTGERQLVFVFEGNGRYEPRVVQLGQEADSYYEVLSGLSNGERVVSSDNFLIDSESRLKAAVSGSAGGHSH